MVPDCFENLSFWLSQFYYNTIIPYVICTLPTLKPKRAIQRIAQLRLHALTTRQFQERIPPIRDRPYLVSQQLLGGSKGAGRLTNYVYSLALPLFPQLDHPSSGEGANFLIPD